MADRQPDSEKEAALALAELHLAGLIKFNGEDEFALNDKGIEYAIALYQSHPAKERLALAMLLRDIDAIIEEAEDAD